MAYQLQACPITALVGAIPGGSASTFSTSRPRTPLHHLRAAVTNPHTLDVPRAQNGSGFRVSKARRRLIERAVAEQHRAGACLEIIMGGNAGPLGCGLRSLTARIHRRYVTQLRALSLLFIAYGIQIDSDIGQVDAARRSRMQAVDDLMRRGSDRSSVEHDRTLTPHSSGTCFNGFIEGFWRPRALPIPRLPSLPALASVGRIPDGTTVDLPGRGRTYVYDSGPCDGPTYLLLHSLACTGLVTWYPALDVIREFGRVVVFDQRCHGQGILPPRMLLEDCADDVAALADVLDIPSFVPVGYSMGSLVAQLVWKRHRERVDGLVLCAAAAAVSRAAYERVATGVFAALIESISPAPRLCEPAKAAHHGYFRDHRWVLSQIRSTSPGSITRAIAEVVRFDSTSWVSEIDVPTAVVVTMKDRAFGVQRQKWLASRIPDAEMVPVDAGHAGCTLQPAAFVPGLRRAIESVHGRLPASRRMERMAE